MVEQIAKTFPNWQKNGNPVPVDLDVIEKDIAHELQRVPHRTTPPALPDYVEDHPSVDDIGKLSSLAIVQQYEGAAKALEAMGADLIDCAKRAEKMASDVKDAITYVQETAEAYRKEAKIVFDRIQQVSMLTVSVREACDDMREKIKQPVVKQEGNDA